MTSEDGVRDARKEDSERRTRIVKDKLDEAFYALRCDGYSAEQEWSCCQSCGWAQLTNEQAERAVFTTDQDEDKLKESGSTAIAWSGDGYEICRAFHVAGLATKWDGKDSTRIQVSNDYPN